MITTQHDHFIAGTTGETLDTPDEKEEKKAEQKELVVVTSNPGKFFEISRELSRLRIKAVQKTFDYPEIQTDELEEVVNYGLDFLMSKIDQPFIIDDSGLFIEPLGGFPGVYSKYVYETLGKHKVLELLCGHEHRKTEFKTVIGYVDTNRQKHIFLGSCEGQIGKMSKGNFGFGYDPIFIPDGHERSFAQMSSVEKNRISHRGNAVRSFLTHLKTEMEGDGE